MKTLRGLKISSIVNGIFCFFCIVFIICMILSHHFGTKVVAVIYVTATIGWMFNPMPIISFILCRRLYSMERCSPEARQIIGKKYIWIYIWPVISVLFYFAAMRCLVDFTGGV